MVTDGAGRPKLVFLYSTLSGRARRIDGYLANVLQRRHNHDTFDIYRVAVEEHPEIAERFGANGAPMIAVVEGKTVVARMEDPRGSREIESFLGRWLRAGRASDRSGLALPEIA